MSADENKHPHGNSVTVLGFSKEDGKVIAFESELDALFNREEVKDRKIVILSIVGIFRKGKSFFLDYVLRYMYANVSQNFIWSDIWLSSINIIFI